MLLFHKKFLSFPLSNYSCSFCFVPGMQVRTPGLTDGNVFVNNETAQQLLSIVEEDFIELDDLMDWSSKDKSWSDFWNTWIQTFILKVQMCLITLIDERMEGIYSKSHFWKICEYKHQYPSFNMLMQTWILSVQLLSNYWFKKGFRTLKGIHCQSYFSMILNINPSTQGSNIVSNKWFKKGFRSHWRNLNP